MYNGYVVNFILNFARHCKKRIICLICLSVSHVNFDIELYRNNKCPAGSKEKKKYLYLS